MDSAGFHQLVKNFTNLTQEESAEAAKLSKQYPYSQILHLLRARASKDLATADRDELLNVSAVYSTDRAVLKELMTAPRQVRIAVAEAKNEESEKQETKEVKKEVRKAVIQRPAKTEPVQQEAKPKLESSSLTGEALRDDIYQELEKLQRLKHDFQVSVEEYEKGVPPVNAASKVAKSEKTASDPLIEEIRTSKKKLKTESPKQNEQNEIIDQFIKSKPVIPKATTTEPVQDLSEDSSLLSDNVVSETLVNLLVKQGKKDKAIEVLKKLIWKFPQKKAYFAAQIESLKN